MHLRIQQCAPAQVSLLTKLVRKTFTEAFAVHNTVENFSSYINTYLTEEQLGKELENPDSNFYFVHYRDDLVGYFKVNKRGAQTELKKEESMELERIYVDARYQGRNIGSWMLQQV
ncbi:MAG TPA: GNAT family N-acetyltransferase, partial [Eudoraea sp.]|nr:GNAT family N-acetyltransferase [Eudoraea sp.]